LFEGHRLTDLLVEAIRKQTADIERLVERAVDTERLERILDEQALAKTSIDTTTLNRMRADMQRSAARGLQPHGLAAFLEATVARYGGRIERQDAGNFHVVSLPKRLEQELQGSVAKRFASGRDITFTRRSARPYGAGQREFVHLAHPLVAAATNLLLRDHGDVLRRGAILVDPCDPGDTARVLFCIEEAVDERRESTFGRSRTAAYQMIFLEIDARGSVRDAGHAPHLDYRPPREEEWQAIGRFLRGASLTPNLERLALNLAVADGIHRYVSDVRQRRWDQVAREQRAVDERLGVEIARLERQLSHRRQAGQRTDAAESKLRRRIGDLQDRRDRRR
ncbi:MAG: hypothetical protein IRY97_12705, partial [Thermomicrobiaceae bacterium]|nr:hypothetical protein [Thermomicrobiaceae bacterium]